MGTGFKNIWQRVGLLLPAAALAGTALAEPIEAAPQKKRAKASKAAAAAVPPTSAIYVCKITPEGCLPVESLTRNAQQAIPPASLNKIMTSVLLHAHMTAQGHSLDTPFASLSDQDKKDGQMGERHGVVKNRGGRTLTKVPAGVTLTYREFFHALNVWSANDAAMAVARVLAGNEANFTQRMTTIAKCIGMSDTEFKSAPGMPATGQLTTAEDMGMLIRYAFQTMGPDMYKEVFGQNKTKIAGHAIDGHIPALKNSDSGFLGGKTGFVAGVFNIAGVFSISSPEGISHYAGIVLGAPARDIRNQTLNTLGHKLKTGLY